MAGPVPVIVRRVRREIANYFESAGATGPEHAIPFDPGTLGTRHTLIRNRMVRRFKDAGVLREAKPGRFYLDRERLSAFVTRMRLTALGIVGAMGAAVAVAAALAN